MEATRKKIGQTIRKLPYDSPIRPDLIKLRYAIDDTLEKSAEAAKNPDLSDQIKSLRGEYAQKVNALDERAIAALRDKNPNAVADVLLNKQSVHNVNTLRRLPRNYFDGGLIIGDSGSFLDSQKLKGIHLAIKSGMLAAEATFEALKTGDTSANMLSAFQKKVEQSYIKKELWKVRNFHQGFSHGQFAGFIHTAFQQITGGRGLVDPMRAHAGHEAYRKIDGMPASERFAGDGKLTFDRLTDVYHSGTRHEEDQPCHLHVADLNVCATKCVEEYGNPCQYFCPAAVYEMVKDAAGQKLKINFANCVHCKTCDIADPYQIITWVVPEGGGGSNYEGM